MRLGADERRQQLLDTALKSFGTNGFSATSMNDVAAAAGVTKPVLYQHFESKHHLYLELLTATADRLTERVQDAVRAESTGRAQLEAALVAYFRFFAEEPGHFTVLYGEGVRSDPSFTKELVLLEGAMTAFTADMIAIPSLQHEDRLLLACGIAGMLEGAVRRWIQEGELRSPEDVAGLTAELIWRGLRGAGTGRS